MSWANLVLVFMVVSNQTWAIIRLTNSMGAFPLSHPPLSLQNNKDGTLYLSAKHRDVRMDLDSPGEHVSQNTGPSVSVSTFPTDLSASLPFQPSPHGLSPGCFQSRPQGVSLALGSQSLVGNLRGGCSSGCSAVSSLSRDGTWLPVYHLSKVQLVSPSRTSFCSKNWQQLTHFPEYQVSPLCLQWEILQKWELSLAYLNM